MDDESSFHDELYNEIGGISQEMLDDCDTPTLKVQVMTLHHKNELINRLKILEKENRESGKALYRECKEMFEIWEGPSDDNPFEVPESIEAYYVNSIYLEDLYSFKKLQGKWE